MPLVSLQAEKGSGSVEYLERRLMTRRAVVTGLAGSTIAVLLAACGPSTTNRATAGTAAAPAAGGSPAAAGQLSVVAAENFWGSIAAQLGGDQLRVASIISNPATDPHDYEPTPDDARLVADAAYVIQNGAGYDPWLQKLLDANPVKGRKTLNVADLAGKKEGDNPHLWYDPSVVSKVADRITQDYQALLPTAKDAFTQQQSQFTNVGLKDYHSLIQTIKQQYGGTPVGATESIFVYLADALGLKLISPPGFMQAVSEGTDIPAADKATFDQQVTQKQLKLLVYNSQNATPDTESLRQKAGAAGIPVVAITETLTPPDATFQAWQAAQLTAIQQGLGQGTGH